MELSPFEFIIMVVGAIVMAADEAIARTDALNRSVPRLRGLARFLPALLVSVAALSYVFHQVGWLPPNEPPSSAGRPMAQDQVTRFVETAKSMSASYGLAGLSPVNLEPEIGCNECTHHALSIAKMLNNAGFQAAVGGSVMGPDRKSGINVFVLEPETSDENILVASFAAAKIAIDLQRAQLPNGASPSRDRPITIQVTPGLPP